MKTTIISVSGYIDSGKDSIANVLVENYGFRIFRMADKLKDVVSDVYGLSRAGLNDNVYKSTPHPNLGNKTPRFVLQFLGTEGFRGVSSSTWVDYAERYFHALPSGSRIVVPDVRFPNEIDKASAVPGTNFFSLAVQRDSAEPFETSNLHESESYVLTLRERADIVLENNGTEKDLRNLVLLWGDTHLRGRHSEI